MNGSSVGLSAEMPPLLDTLANDVENAQEHLSGARYRLAEQVDRLLGPVPQTDTNMKTDQPQRGIPTDRIARATGRVFSLCEEIQQLTNRLSRL